MPSRIIRDGLLDSERYWSVGIEARQLFIHLMLLADDFGLVSLAPLYVRRRCFNDNPSAERVARLIAELQDADLIRCYQCQRGAPYGFIPRFNQRLQRKTMKCPPPPQELFADDDELLEKLSKINDEVKNPALGSAGQPPEVEVEEEEKRKTLVLGSTKSAVPDCPQEEIVRLYHELCPALPAVRVWHEKRSKSLRARWREDATRQNLGWWAKYFRYVSSSAFLCGAVPGKQGRQWSASLDWLLSPDNMVKVIEGNYHEAAEEA